MPELRHSYNARGVVTNLVLVKAIKIYTIQEGMLELVLGSFFVGSLGLQALVTGSWVYGWQRSQKKHQDEEEERLTPYEFEEQLISVPEPTNGKVSLDLTQLQPDSWEYKIVRANGDLFRDPEVFQQLCQEEAEADWILLEKLDDRRVRFRRLRSVGNAVQPETLGFDPYRCYYGSSWTVMNWFGAIAILASLILPAYLGYTLVTQLLNHSQPSTPSQSFPTSEPSISP